MIRYYLHGDQHEDGGDKWYCARSDLFVAQAHFLQGDKDYQRYLDGLKGLKTVLKNGRGRYVRPSYPPNCIA